MSRWLSRLIRKQFLEDMLEDCICEARVDISKANADHFVCFLVLWDLIDQSVGEALCERGKLFLIKPQ